MKNYTKEDMQKNWEEFQNLNNFSDDIKENRDSKLVDFNGDLNEFSSSHDTVSANLKKYPSKVRRGELSEFSDSNSINTSYKSNLVAPRIRVRNQNTNKSEIKGDKFDEFVEIYIRDYIPCILIPPHFPSSKIIVYFHANAEDIGQSYPLCSEINDDLDCYVMIVEYCGYSIYPGSPAQDRLERDSLAIWNYLTKIMNFKPSDIIILGRSIGTGSALYLSTQVNPGALCLISPFTSIKDVVKFNYGGIASGFLKERFSNKNRILDVNCPVLFIHGKEDKLIPYKDSKSLYGKFLPISSLNFKNFNLLIFDRTLSDSCRNLDIQRNDSSILRCDGLYLHPNAQIRRKNRNKMER